MLGLVAAPHEFASEPAEQFGVRGLPLLPVFDRLDQTAAQQALPDAIDHHLRETFIAWSGDQGGQSLARIVRRRRAPLRCVPSPALGSQNAANGHWGGTFVPGLSVTWMSGLRPPSVSLSSGTLLVVGTSTGWAASIAASWNRSSWRLRCAGGVMAARTFHLDAQECGAEDGRFRGHRHVVLRRDSKTGRPAEPLAPPHPHQLGDEQVERFVVS